MDINYKILPLFPVDHDKEINKRITDLRNEMNYFNMEYAEHGYGVRDLDGLVSSLSTSIGATQILLVGKIEGYVNQFG